MEFLKEIDNMKTARQLAILDIIAQRDITTQEDIAAALAARGFTVTQATVSRDMKELKLTKSLSADGNYRYSQMDMPEYQINSRFVHLLGDAVVSITCAYNQIIIKTVSASAGMACETIDHLHWPEILGTIAGENTILVIVRSVEEACMVVDRLNTLLHREG